MGKPKTMKLLDQYTGLMECKYCGTRHYRMIKSGKCTRGTWQCHNPNCPGPGKGPGRRA